MKVLVCGGRDFNDRRFVYNELDKRHAVTPISLLICGGARGADQLAQDWASYRRVACRVFNADWETHGRAAGPIRNQLMLDDGTPDLVMAFPGNRGTADMVRRATELGVKTHYIGDTETDGDDYADRAEWKARR